jgi:predicted solute-binding protein
MEGVGSVSGIRGIWDACDVIDADPKVAERAILHRDVVMSTVPYANTCATISAVCITPDGVHVRQKVVSVMFEGESTEGEVGAGGCLDLYAIDAQVR